jgi:hypothetical protein
MVKLIAILIFSFFPFLFFGDHYQYTTPTIANRYAPFYKMIAQGEKQLQEGDLVLRINQDPSSQFIKNFNRKDKRYSHSGIVVYEEGYPYIFHMVSGDENPHARLKKDSLKNYCNPRKNDGYAVYRYRLQWQETEALKECIKNWYAQGLRFDSLFNLATNDHMYCSEMVKKALAKATANRIQITETPIKKWEALTLSHYLKLPLSYTKKLRLIAIDDLYINDYCSLVSRFDFK